jgi:hypothetical protein
MGASSPIAGFVIEGRRHDARDDRRARTVRSAQ